MVGVQRRFRPYEEGSPHIDTLVRNRCRIVGASPDTTLYINGKEVQIGAEIGPGAVLNAVRSSRGVVAESPWVTIEEE